MATFEELEKRIKALENRTSDQEHLMATHPHAGNVSTDIKDRVLSIIDDDENIASTMTASDNIKSQELDEVTRSTGSNQLIYTIYVASQGTLRLSFEGKRDAGVIGYINTTVESQHGQVDSESYETTTTYTEESYDLDVEIGYKVKILISYTGGETIYLRNVKVGYDIEKVGLTKFI